MNADNSVTVVFKEYNGAQRILHMRAVAREFVDQLRHDFQAESFEIR